ncbi:MAG TPA: carboxymuconolactone decarboxylase family protein [Burkholderiales bacterium]|nr:carboxymuconolactone decarboxylase family protein [Burkholderiales bacterium]
MTESERYRRGVEILRQVGGPEFDTPLKALEDVAPDLVRLAVEFGYGEIMSRPALDLPTRQLATVAALCAMGNAPSQLRYHIEGALNVGCPASHVTEVVLASSGIVGSGLARDGLLAMNEVLRRRGLTPPIEVAAAEDPARYEARLDPRLDRRTKVLATIALLTALGTAHENLKLEVRAALDSGVTRVEIVEAIQQMALYAGFPAALNGIAAAKEVFAGNTAVR